MACELERLMLYAQPGIFLFEGQLYPGEELSAPKALDPQQLETMRALA
ncbi:MAG: hypothetical protein ACI8TQ_000425 [Planctomycetota bacterium]|jgi:hypothetical protein